MYSSLPTFVLGFHGCDRSVAEKILAGNQRLKASRNEYDWLGHGSYFWENNPARALEFAAILRDTAKRSRPKVTEPFVIGAIIDLGHCFNLLGTGCLAILAQSYEDYRKVSEAAGVPLPQNKPLGSGTDVLLRYLDCAVIEFMYQYHETRGQRPYDSARGLFPEGDPVFPGATIRDKDHIQICVRNPNCIKGYFRILEPVPGYPIP